MKFKLKADAEFEAKDLDDALRLWMEHFKALTKMEDTKPFFIGNIEIIQIVKEKVVITREKIKSTRKERRKFFFKDKAVRIAIVVNIILWIIVILWKT